MKIVTFSSKVNDFHENQSKIDQFGTHEEATAISLSDATAIPVDLRGEADVVPLLLLLLVRSLHVLLPPSEVVRLVGPAALQSWLYKFGSTNWSHLPVCKCSCGSATNKQQVTNS